MSLPKKDSASALHRPEKLGAKVLRPIIGILLRAGVPFNTFAAVARRIYVDIARREFGIRGRKTNMSRVAMLTGLTRTKVRQELDLLEGNHMQEDIEDLDKVRHASRMLLGWHTDARFSDEQNHPIPLTIDGESPSFAELYNDYSGKVVPLTSMLKELITVGAVDYLEDKRVIARSRSYTPQSTDNAAMERICQAINDLASTASYNLYNNGKQRARLERFATNQLIAASREKEFRDFLEHEGQAFLERVDNWLAEAESADDEEPKVRIGVGLYQISSAPIKKGNS